MHDQNPPDTACIFLQKILNYPYIYNLNLQIVNINMSAPKGNTYAKDNRGGGRKSAYEELQDAEWLERVWNMPQNYDALKERIEVTKQYSARDAFLYRALNGSDAVLRSMADKLLASKAEIDLNASVQPSSESMEELQKAAAAISAQLIRIETE